LFASSSFEVTVEVGLQGEGNVDNSCKFIVESATAFRLSAPQLFCEMGDQSYFLFECLDIELIGIGEGSFLEVYLCHFVDELHDDATQFERLDGFFCVFVEVVIRLYQFELLVLELELQFVDLGKELDSINYFIQTFYLYVSLVTIDEVCAILKNSSLQIFHILIGDLV